MTKYHCNHHTVPDAKSIAVPTRLYQALMFDLEVVHLEELRVYSEYDLLRRPNIGRKSLSFINKVLEGLGVSLKGSEGRAPDRLKYGKGKKQTQGMFNRDVNIFETVEGNIRSYPTSKGYKELAEKYEISISRVRQIYLKMQRRRQKFEGQFDKDSCRVVKKFEVTGTFIQNLTIEVEAVSENQAIGIASSTPKNKWDDQGAEFTVDYAKEKEND